MSLVKPTLRSTALRWRLVGGRVLAMVAMACGTLSAVDAEQATVSIGILNGRSQVHVTSTAPGRIIPPNQDAQIRVSLGPVPQVSSKQFYLRLNQENLPTSTILDLMWSDDVDGDGTQDVTVESPNGSGGWTAIASLPIVPPATVNHNYAYQIVKGTTSDTVRITINKGYDHLDLKVRGEVIKYLNGKVQAIVIGLPTGVGDGTVTGTNQSVDMQLISDQTVARNIVTAPNVKETDAFVNGGLIFNEGDGIGRVWFGCEAWNPYNSYSGSVTNRTNTQKAIYEDRVITQSLDSLVSGLGVAQIGSDFSATLRFGAARYQGEGKASTGPTVRDAAALVTDQSMVIGKYAYRRTTEWGPSRVSTAMAYLVSTPVPWDNGTWTSVVVTPKAGNNLNDSITLTKESPTTVGLPGHVAVTNLTPAPAPVQLIQLDLSQSMPVFVGDTVRFDNGATFIISGTSGPDEAPTSTYDPKNNGSVRTLAGNQPRMDIDYVTVNSVAVPNTARNVKVFFPNLQGKDGDVYYSAPVITALNGGAFAGLTELYVTASNIGRPYSGVAALNPTILTLDWGTADPAAATVTAATIASVALNVGVDYTMSAGNLTMTLTPAGQAKLNGGDPTRAFLRANSAVTFGSGSATVVYEDLASPWNDPLHYGDTGIKQGETVNIWYTEEKNDVIYVEDSLGAGATLAAVQIGTDWYYAAKGKDGTLPATDEVSISVTTEGNEVKINKKMRYDVGASVILYPASTTAPVGMFTATGKVTTKIVKFPTVKLATAINEPVLYGNPDATGVYYLPVSGGNYVIWSGDQVNTLGYTWTCYGVSREGAALGTDPRSRKWVSAWEDTTDTYVALWKNGFPALPATFYIPRATTAANALMSTHLAIPYTQGSVTAMIPGRITEAGHYGGIYPLADPGDPAHGAFQQGDYMEYFYKPLNDATAEGKEEFTVILRQDGENNGYEVMDPQSSTFTVWDNDSSLALGSTTAMSIKTKTGETTVLDSQNGQLSFALTQALPTDTLVNYTVEPGTLVFGDDFDISGARKDANGVITGSLVISAGTTSVNLVIKPKTKTVIAAKEIKAIKLVISQNPSYNLSGVQSSSAGLQTILNYTRDSGAASTTAGGSPNGITPGGSTGGNLDGDAISNSSSNNGSGCGAGSGVALVMLGMAGVALRRRKIKVQGDC